MALRPPYSQETAPTVSPEYPAYPNFRQSIPMVPSIHSLQECPRGHTDYKTTRLHSQPTESITKTPRGGKYREYRKSLAEAIQRKA